MGELLRMHRPPLVTIKALGKEIPYYVNQLRVYAETALDAAPTVISRLGGMQYRLDKEDQSVRRRIWALYHPLGGAKEGDTEDTAIMELGAITA